MPSFRPALPISLLVFAACSSDLTPPGGVGRDATNTSTAADAQADLDGDLADTGGAVDTGLIDMGVNRDATPSDRADGGGGAQCTELAMCCPQLPAQTQGQCNNTAAAGDEMRCGQALAGAQQGGYCVPGGTDAEPRDGPLGPICSELAGCCANAGQLQALCEGAANGGDEARCDRILQLAQQFGVMCMSMMDAGTSTVGDAGTSTVGDAGTSTVGDAG